MQHHLGMHANGHSKIHYNLCKQQTATQSKLASDLSKSASSKLLRFCKIWLGKQCAYYQKVFIIWTLPNKRECNLTMHFIDMLNHQVLCDCAWVKCWFAQEIHFYFTKITIISIGINDACLLVSLIPMGPAEGAYLSNILSLV